MTVVYAVGGRSRTWRQAGEVPVVPSGVSLAHLHVMYTL